MAAGTIKVRDPEEGRVPQEIKGYTRPPQEMPAHMLERGEAKEKKAPIVITLFTWLCLLRAASYFLVAFILWSYPESSFSTYLVSNPAWIYRRTSRSAGIYGGPEETTVREFILVICLFMGVLYSVTFWKWYTRFWLARWGLMFVCGATAIKTAVYMTADQIAGSEALLSDVQRAGMLVSIGLNILICGYLAFYPGVSQAFKENSWD
jgi:hypothetical protein